MGWPEWKVGVEYDGEQHWTDPNRHAEDIERLATEDSPDIPALHGWRREVFGDAALALKDGRIALGASGREVRLIPL